MALTVACVEWGNYLGRGEEYVLKLQRMVYRNLRRPFAFEVLTPDSGLVGWWNKIELFRPGRFEGRVLYLDLDTVIVGPLDELVDVKGCIHLDQWGWKQKVYGSGAMVWDAGEHEDVFARFTPGVARRLRGDQDWLTELGGWGALPFPLVCSAKYHCKNGPPEGASVVCCHGPKKPHCYPSGHWMRQNWA